MTNGDQVLGEIRLTIWRNGQINVTRETDDTGESGTYNSPFQALGAVMAYLEWFRNCFPTVQQFYGIENTGKD